MYICTYVCVGHAWNVNLSSCSGTQVSLIHALHEDMRMSMEDELGKEGNDVSWQWRMGRTMWLGLHNVRIW